jgi:hypothetical protein
MESKVPGSAIRAACSAEYGMSHHPSSPGWFVAVELDVLVEEFHVGVSVRAIHVGSRLGIACDPTTEERNHQVCLLSFGDEVRV